MIYWFICFSLNQLPHGLVNNTIKRCGKPAVILLISNNRGNPHKFPSLSHAFTQLWGKHVWCESAFIGMRRARVFVPWSAKSPESYTNTVYVKYDLCSLCLCSKYSNANVVFRGRHFLSKFSSICLFFYLSISERSSAGKHNGHHSAVAWRSLTQFLTVQGVSGYLASHDSTPGHCFALAAFISQRLRVR